MSDRIKVLLIEDDTYYVDVIREMLDYASVPFFDLVRAARLSEGLQRLSSEKFDVVLLDLGLPDSRGLETFERLQDRASELPIIVLSGLSDEDVAVDAVRSGAQDYLIKGQVNADLLARAIRYAIERKRAKEKIQRHNRELTALNEIAQTINSTLDLQETLTLIAEYSIHLLDTEATSVLLCDEGKGDLWFAAASGAGADAVQGQRLSVDQGIVGWVVQRGEPVLVPDVSQDPRWFSGFDEEGDFITRSLLCVPLRSRGRVIGALEAVNKRSGAFDEEDLRLLSLLAEPATTAIENARLFEQVRTNSEQLRALSHRLVDVQEAERRRVARELHDEIGQTLSSLLLSLTLMEGEVDNPVAVITRINQLEGLIDRTLDDLHRLAMDLRPATLDHLGLVPALEHYVEVIDEQSGVTARFEVVGLGKERLSAAIETSLYRIVQEALTNTRHSQATRIDVLLERRGDQVVAIVEDNGDGFDPDMVSQEGTRLGLLGMQERTEMVGGSLTIESEIGKGTTIVAEVPYVQAKAE